MTKFIHDELSQEFYDSFNNFIFAPEYKVFHKLLTKLDFAKKTHDIPGDIIELGVFKGSGFLAWLKTLRYCNSNKKVVGFDFFDQKENLEKLDGQQKTMMKNLFEQRSFSHQEDYDIVLSDIVSNCGFEKGKQFDLVKGDVIHTVNQYLENNPGFRCSVVNFDLDTAIPTYHCMNFLWDRLVPGGYFIFDEYAINEWDESNGVDKFMKERKIEKIFSTNQVAPSAFIRK